MSITITKPVSVSVLVADVVRAQTDAAETIDIAGRVMGVLYSENASSGSVQVAPAWSQAISGRITTLTINLTNVATDGKLLIFYCPN